VRAAGPLLALGFARLVSTRAAGYQHPVAEYGVHWNFFFTAAAVSLLTLLSQLPPRLLLPAGLAVAAAHQAALSLLGGSAWVHSDARGSGWVSLNQEGVGSIPGYWALSLLGAAAGHHLRRSAAAAASRMRAALSAAGKRGGSSGGGNAGSASGGGVEAASWAVWLWVAWLLAIDAAAWALLWPLETAVEPVSRRWVGAAVGLLAV
jgi:phosphatidylinositol glycan class W